MRIGCLLMMAISAHADVSLPGGGGWSPCQPVFSRLEKLGFEITEEGGALSATYNLNGGDRCLSGSEYRLTLQKRMDSPSKWTALDGEDGVRRHFSRRIGNLRASIDTVVWDGPDEASTWVPVMKRAAQECSRLLH